MKSSGTAFLLWCASFFGFCGMHRFYLGKPWTGALYFFTFGLAGIGQIIDLFRIPGMVEHENIKWQLRQGATVNLNIQGFSDILDAQRRSADTLSPQAHQEAIDPKTDVETTILKLARQYKGRLTPVELAVNSSLSLEEAENALEEIVRKGYANMTVADTGNIIYEFPGFLQFDASDDEFLKGYEKI